jgi:hypothetical protein
VSDNEYYLGLAFVICLFLFGTVAFVAHRCFQTDIAMAEKGYTQAAVPGSDGVYWVKP